MKLRFLVPAVLLAACALRPDWHWEKPEATEADLAADLNRCKQASYAGTDGMVTQAMVQRMHACLLGAGWRKTPNR